MHRRSIAFAVIAFLLLVACRLTYAEPILPTVTAPLPVTDTVVVTETPEKEPIATADSLNQLEVIQSGNWSRLQLLKTIPAEMPLNHSAVAISPDGKTLAIGSSNGAHILFFDLANEQSTWVDVNGVSNSDAYFNKMEYLSDGTFIANSDGPYRIYHIDAAGNVLSAWDGIGFAISADKRIMAHTDVEGIALVEIANDTPIASLTDGSGLDFSFSPDGSKIAAEDVGVDTLHTAVWDIPNKVLLNTLDETAAPRFSPDGKFLAAVRYDYENDRTPLKIFSPDGMTEITTLDVIEANGLSNKAPLWSLDSSLIVAQVAKGSPVAWDTTSWQLLEAPALQGDLYAFSPDGRILITRTSDGGILLWGVLP